MLGPCYPIAQAALGAVVRPLRHTVRHWAHHGTGHGARHVPVHHAAVPHIAAPQAAGPMIACAKMPGSLPAGQLPAAAAGPAGSGAVAGPIGGVAGSGYAGSGGMFGSAGLAAAAAPLAAAALIAAGLVTGAMARPNQPFRFEQPASQPVAMASMTPPVIVKPASNAFSPDLSFPETPVTLAAGPQPSVTTPNLLEQMPEVSASSTGRSAGSDTGSTAVPEPASLALLGFCVVSALAAREWGRASQGRFALAPGRTWQ